MTWEHVIKILVPILCAAITPFIPALLSWLKTQKFVRQAHLESMLETLIPAVVNAVEAWAANLPDAEKPDSSAKLAKAKEILARRAPMLSDMEDAVHRIEGELFKRKNGNGA